MSYLKMLVAAVMFLCATQAQAALYYVDAPWFTSADQPVSTECVQTDKGKILGVDVVYWHCNQDIQAPKGNFRARMHDTEYNETFIDSIPYQNLVQCSQGYCTRNKTEYMEGFAQGLDQDTLYIMSVPLGWYVMATEDSVKIHRWGTGPRAQDFPNILLWGDAQQPSYASTQTTYDVWCNPRSDFCDYTDSNGNHQVAREDLNRYIPMADPQTAECFPMEYTCQNADGDVVGLNPDRY